jgi:alkyl hydroperoxide reductase subunit AhpC
MLLSCWSCRSGLFIIAPDGTLRQKTVNDLPVGRSVDETLRLVKAFQVSPVAAVQAFAAEEL